MHSENPVETWKGRPLPVAGFEVDARWLDKHGTRTERLVVDRRRLSDDGTLVLTRCDGRMIRLDPNCLIDRWHHTVDAFTAMREGMPGMLPSRTVDEMIADGRYDHRRRMETDPVYAYHADALAERTDLARLDPDADELAQVDYSDPDAEVEARQVGAPDVSVIDHSKLRRLDLLKQEKSRTKKTTTDIESQIKVLEDLIITEMVESGQPTGYPFGDRKATVGSKVWGKWNEGTTEAERYAAFRKAGGPWAELVQPRINASTLQSLLTEWEREHGELPHSLPSEIQAVMTTVEKHHVTFSDVAPTRAVRRGRTATDPGSQATD